MQITKPTHHQHLALEPALSIWWIRLVGVIRRFWPQFIIVGVIALYLSPILASGQIVFSDLAFGVSSQRYLSQIFGIWNNHWNTPNLFNLPRLIYILPFYLLSVPFGFSGAVLLKSLIYGVVVISALSFFTLARGILRAFYQQSSLTVTTRLILVAGSLLYALNPWVMMRIQHIFLLCGYSLLPLVIYYFLHIFHPHFAVSQTANSEARPIKRRYYSSALDVLIFALLYSVMAASIHFAIYAVFVLMAIGTLTVASEIRQLRVSPSATTSVHVFRLAIILVLFTILLLPVPIITLATAALVVFIRLNKQQRWFVGRTALKSLGVIFATSIACFYWLAPYMVSIVRDVLPSQLNVNTAETIDLFSQHSSLVNVLYGNSYWWPMFDYASLPITYFIGGGNLLISALFSLRPRPKKLGILFACFASILILLATGTKYPVLDQLYPKIVLGGVIPFGNMFRDPDKLVGLWMLVLSLMVVVGAHYLTNTLLQAKKPVITQIANLFCLMLFLSLAYYLMPFRTIYVEGFYKPVQFPPEYVEAETFLAENVPQDARIVYLPTSENMVDPNYGYASPSWNLATIAGLTVPRATNDFQIFNADYDTLFHQEGNPPFVEYYYNYLQYVLDHGNSSHVGELLSISGADYLVYYSDYLTQRPRQDLNLDVLALQHGLHKVFQNSRVSIYAIQNPLPEAFLLPRSVFTPYGVDRLERFAAFEDFDFSHNGVIFTSADTLPAWEGFSMGDYVEAAHLEDLLLSTLPAEYYIVPFDAIEAGSSWQKTYTQNQDWRWQLDHHNLQAANFDLDFGLGIAFTDAPARIHPLDLSSEAIEPLLVSYLPGDDTSVALLSSTSELLNVTLEQTGSETVLSGQLASTATVGTWYTARSDLINVVEGTPYRFYANLSGSNTREMHFKIHYYDAHNNEVGVEYILGSQSLEDFIEGQFKTLFFAPPGTRAIQIALLVRPSVIGVETTWQLHHLRLEDLSAYRQPNTINMTLAHDSPVQGALYGRLFFSPAGGTVVFDVNGTSTQIDTVTDGPQGFEWVKIADITATEFDATHIQVNNIAGFNAVNVLALIPQDQFMQLADEIHERLRQARMFLTLEAEEDFAYVGSQQSAFTYPMLSSGGAIRSQDGTLESVFEVIKASSYTIDLRYVLPTNPAGSISVELLDSSGAVVIENQLSSVKTAAMPGETTNVIVPDATTGLPVVTQAQSRITTMQNTQLTPIYLAPGEYRLRIQFDSQAHLLAGAENIAPLAGQQGITVAHNAGGLQAIYEPSETDNWYILTTPISALDPNSAVFANLTLHSERVRDRHIKVKFFDVHHNELSQIYFDEIDPFLQSDWHTYSRYLVPPPPAQFMQLQILARASRSEPGLIEIEGMELWQDEDLAMLDRVAIYETGPEVLWGGVSNPEELTQADFGSLGCSVHYPSDARSDQFVVLPEAYSPLWQADSESPLVLPFSGLLSMAHVSSCQPSLTLLDINLMYWIGLIGFGVYTVVTGLVAVAAYRGADRSRSSHELF